MDRLLNVRPQSLVNVIRVLVPRELSERDDLICSQSYLV